MRSRKILSIPVLLGTVRQGRESEKVAEWLLARVSNRSDIETQLVDPRDMDLPENNEGQDLKEQNREYCEVISRADGLIIVVPEYNHGYPGSLKRALDVLWAEYVHKAVGLCGVSSGQFGGVRAVEQIIGIVHALGLVPTHPDLYIPNVGDFFRRDGTPVDKVADERADKFISEVAWMAAALRWGKENDSRNQKL